MGVGVFYLVPFLDVIRRTFTSIMGNSFIGLENIKMVLNNEAFQLAVYNTVHFVTVCIPILLILSLMIALLLQKQTVFNKLMKSAFLVPMSIPIASIVLLWNILFHPNGMLNNFLHNFGKSIDWMNSSYAFGVLVFSYVWKNLGYTIVLWLAGLSGIPFSIYEAAEVDGAGRWQSFWYITVPNLWATVFIITVLSIVNSFKVFREAYLVAGSYPHESIYMLQHLFNNWFRELSIDKMAAGAVLNSAVLLILILVLQKICGGMENRM